MSPARMAALLLCGLVGSLPLAGCDSDNDRASDEDYVAEAQAVAKNFAESVNQISKQISQLEKLDLASAGGLLQTFSDRVDDLAARIEDISPPEAVQELHRRLVDLLENFGSRAQQAAIALKAGDLLGGLPTLTKFAVQAAEVGNEVDATVGQIKAKLGLG
jgi:hypothetical protein